MARNNWTSFAQKITPLEKAFRPKIVRIIKDFREAFISDLKAHGHSTAVSNLQMRPYANSLPATIETLYKRSALIGIQLQYATLRPFEAEARRMLARQKQLKAGGFGRNEQWVREVLNFIKIHLLEVLQDMTDTMREDILKVLQKGFDKGLTIPEIIKELMDEGLIESRARVITRTEINKGANAGHKIVAQSTPYEVDKGWSAAKDERTRPGHRDMDGHKVGEHDLFRVPIYRGKILIGHEDMDGPGDPEASASNIVNCRCRRLYFPKRDANGALIMRDRTLAPVIPMRRPQEYTPAQIAAILKANIFVGVQK